MGYNVSFRANQSYGVESLNMMAMDFSETQETTFEEGVTYGIDSLNGIRQDIVTAGIVKGYASGCACSNASGVLTVASGKAFFASGVRVEIDTNGMSVAYTAGTSGTVWLQHVPALNEVFLVFAATITGDAVKVATVSAAGVVTDARQYCSMKNASLLPNQVHTASITLNLYEKTVGKLVGSYTADAAGYGQLLIKNQAEHFNGFFNALYTWETTPTLQSVYWSSNGGSESSDTTIGFYVFLGDGARQIRLRAEYTSDTVNFYLSRGDSTVTTVYLDLLFF